MTVEREKIRQRLDAKSMSWWSLGVEGAVHETVQVT